MFAVAAIKLHPDWGEVAHGFVPGAHAGGSLVVYLYFVVGLLGAAMTPYEVYFYSSGAVEDGWGVQDLGLEQGDGDDRIRARRPLVRGTDDRRRGGVPAARHLAKFLGTPPLAAEHVSASSGCCWRWSASSSRSAAQPSRRRFSGAYNLAQFFGWKWGKKERPAGAPRFTLAWIVIFAARHVVAMTGYDPIKLTEYSVIFSVVALPLTYLPILLVANDPTYMGTHVNGRLANVLGSLYLVVILAIAIAAIPLMLMTHGGQG